MVPPKNAEPAPQNCDRPRPIQTGLAAVLGVLGSVKGCATEPVQALPFQTSPLGVAPSTYTPRLLPDSVTTSWWGRPSARFSPGRYTSSAQKPTYSPGVFCEGPPPTPPGWVSAMVKAWALTPLLPLSKNACWVALVVCSQSSTVRALSPCSAAAAGPATAPLPPSKLIAVSPSPGRPGSCSVTPPLSAAPPPWPLESATAALLPVFATRAWLATRP